GDTMTAAPPTAPVSADAAPASHAESKAKSEPTASVSSSQPSGDR
ncbi:twin-arginine translocase subunit TatB, partial [Pseudomonas syringae pv. actinidiae]|nr:twin-arginine translocase subunit TatB [Pseudomonas syringae pv. actinidiae]